MLEHIFACTLLGLYLSNQHITLDQSVIQLITAKQQQRGKHQTRSVMAELHCTALHALSMRLHMALTGLDWTVLHCTALGTHVGEILPGGVVD
eukprot:2842190-Pyramimonas_sp.AAC.1